MNIGRESEQIEFKTGLAEQKAGFESICAILNKHKKGKLYFGVSDKGDVVGVQIGKDTTNHLSRDLEIQIKPAFMHTINVLKSDDNLEFIEVIFSGDNSPYSANGKYLMRFADRDKVMDQETLWHFFQSKKSSYNNWENASSNCCLDDVDDEVIKDYISRGNNCGRIKFQYDDKRKVLGRLGLLFDESTLNNAGNVLFSSKGPVSVKLATFASSQRKTILDMNVFNGNVFECIKESISYISKHIDWNIVFDGSINSKEVPEIPMIAVREIVVNAFAHGSYEAISTEFEISVYKDRVTIYSPGHFPQPFTPEQFAYGGQEAIPLNNKICSILYNDETIEKHSTGFERTFDVCSQENVKYDYTDTGLGFRFTFYRKGMYEANKQTLTDRDKLILTLLKEDPSISNVKLAQVLNVSEKTIYRSFKKLKELGYIIKDKNNEYWILLK